MPDEPGSIKRLEAARAIARAAGDLTLQRFRSRELAVDHKRDGSVVTVADRETERLMRESIIATFPDDGILGEEHGEHAGTSPWRWILDPIDGTVSFVHGVPLYGTLLAVEYNGQPRIGVIHMPALNETVYASIGCGAWHTTDDAAPVPAKVSETACLASAMLCTTAFDYFVQAGCREVFLTLAERCGTTRGWSDCYAHVLLATGRVDAVVEPVINPWDVAPLIPILREAGGRYTDWSGRETAYSRQGLATNGRLHDDVLALLRNG